MLAGLMKAPSKLAPNRNPEGASERAAQVITAMAQEGHITEAMAKVALANPAARPSRQRRRLDQLRRRLCDGRARRHGRRDRPGHRRHDDARSQSAGRRRTRADRGTRRKGRANSASRQGALVALDPDGAIRALVGGRDYARKPVQPRRRGEAPAGLVLQALRLSRPALEHGLTPDTVREDAPINVKGWQPENYSREYFGPVTLTKALSLSLNTVAVRARPGGRPQGGGRARRIGSASLRSCSPTPRSRSARRR